MRLRFLTSMAGPSCAFIEGQVIEVTKPTPEMQQWLRAGVVLVEPEEAVLETTDVDAPAERAVLPQRRRRRGGPPGVAE